MTVKFVARVKVLDVDPGAEVLWGVSRGPGSGAAVRTRLSGQPLAEGGLRLARTWAGVLPGC